MNIEWETLSGRAGPNLQTEVSDGLGVITCASSPGSSESDWDGSSSLDSPSINREGQKGKPSDPSSELTVPWLRQGQVMSLQDVNCASVPAQAILLSYCELTGSTFVAVTHSLANPQSTEHKQGTESKTGDHRGNRSGSCVAGSSSNEAECAHLDHPATTKLLV